MKFCAGDLVIPVRQQKMAYIVEMLEPRASGSFFRRKFFDAVPGNREYFSSYGFEEIAMQCLSEYPEFNRKFLQKKNDDKSLASDQRAQLGWIYSNSVFAEESHRRYPAGKIFHAVDIEKLTVG